MFGLYHSLNEEIERAVMGTNISAAYLAAVISLESHPPGNRNSRRFEPKIYRRLVEARMGVRPYGSINSRRLRKYTDDEIAGLDEATLELFQAPTPSGP